MIGQHYNHPNGDTYEVLMEVDGKTSNIPWIAGVLYRSLTTEKPAWTSLERFNERFTRNIFSEKLALSKKNEDICDPEEIMS